MIWLGVMLAGAAGAACRYAVDHAVTLRSGGTYPWGTLVVNLSGSLLIGIVAGLVAHRGVSEDFGFVLAAGFCGAYTTFSTLVYEALRLVSERAYLRAALHLGSIVVGGLAAAVGWTLTLL